MLVVKEIRIGSDFALAIVFAMPALTAFAIILPMMKIAKAAITLRPYTVSNAWI